MIVKLTEGFLVWLANLKDERARARVIARLDRLSLGNPGDVKAVGLGVSEMRIDYGPGYRVYFVQRGEVLFVVLAGGSKKTQSKDIELALKAAANLEVAE